VFITFEGIEGSGKTTQLRRLAERIPHAVVTKEPGGTPIGDRIRAILLDPQSTGMDATTELFLYAASRRQLVAELIRPALERGGIVLCDRYTDSTLAYQGFGRLLNLDELRTLNDWATGGLVPGVTLLFDLPEDLGLRRARSRNDASTALQDEGRFEWEGLRFHRRVREGYLTLALSEPLRYIVIDAQGSPDDVFTRVVAALAARVPGVLP
jgi:dTMP kinase